MKIKMSHKQLNRVANAALWVATGFWVGTCIGNLYTGQAIPWDSTAVIVLLWAYRALTEGVSPLWVARNPLFGDKGLRTAASSGRTIMLAETTVGMEVLAAILHTVGAATSYAEVKRMASLAKSDYDFRKLLLLCETYLALLSSTLMLCASSFTERRYILWGLNRAVREAKKELDADPDNREKRNTYNRGVFVATIIEHGSRSELKGILSTIRFAYDFCNLVTGSSLFGSRNSKLAEGSIGKLASVRNEAQVFGVDDAKDQPLPAAILLMGVKGETLFPDKDLMYWQLRGRIEKLLEKTRRGERGERGEKAAIKRVGSLPTETVTVTADQMFSGTSRRKE